MSYEGQLGTGCLSILDAPCSTRSRHSDEKGTGIKAPGLLEDDKEGVNGYHAEVYDEPPTEVPAQFCRLLSLLRLARRGRLRQTDRACWAAIRRPIRDYEALLRSASDYFWAIEG